MIIFVGNDMDQAIRELKRKVDRDGLTRELRIRAYPQPGERRKVKAGLAEKRRRQAEARKRARV